MLTKSQAQAAADALVEGGKAERIDRLEKQADRIPFYYRNSSLSRLPGWRQSQLVAQARRTAHSTGLGIAGGIGMLVVGWAVWFSSEHAFTTLGPLELAFGGIATLFRIMLVKLRLQELLIEELTRQQSDGI